MWEQENAMLHEELVDLKKVLEISFDKSQVLCEGFKTLVVQKQVLEAEVARFTALNHKREQ